MSALGRTGPPLNFNAARTRGWFGVFALCLISSSPQSPTCWARMLKPSHLNTSEGLSLPTNQLKRLSFTSEWAPAERGGRPSRGAGSAVSHRTNQRFLGTSLPAGQRGSLSPAARGAPPVPPAAREPRWKPAEGSPSRPPPSRPVPAPERLGGSFPVGEGAADTWRPSRREPARPGPVWPGRSRPSRSAHGTYLWGGAALARRPPEEGGARGEKELLGLFLLQAAVPAAHAAGPGHRRRRGLLVVLGPGGGERRPGRRMGPRRCRSSPSPRGPERRRRRSRGSGGPAPALAPLPSCRASSRAAPPRPPGQQVRGGGGSIPAGSWPASRAPAGASAPPCSLPAARQLRGALLK